MISLLWLGLRNLARQRWLALVLPVSVSISLMGYLVLTAVHSELIRRYDHLSQSFLVVEQGGTIGEFYGSRVPENSAALLRARGASLVEAEIRTVTGTTPGDMVLLRGISLETYDLTEDYQITAGRPLTRGDPARRVMVGERLAADRQLAVGDTLSIRGRDFTVQAIFVMGTYSDYEAWISLEDAQKLLGWEGEVSIFIVPAGEVLQVGEILPGGLTVIQKGESGTNLVAEFRQFFDLLSLIAVTLGVSAAINLANALWRMAWQYRRELAILQAVGFSRGALAFYLGCQGASITLVGFILGVAEGLLVMSLTRLKATGITIQPILDEYTIALTLAYALGVLVLSTIVPVAWLSRLNLAGLLREE